MIVGVYPGSFDPVTNGHLNIVERGLTICDRLIVAVSSNIRKKPLFTAEERVEMLRDCFASEPRVEVDAFDSLLVEYAVRRSANVILRGLRAISDFEIEFQMAHMNRRLAASVETVFMMTGAEHFYVSSSLVREVATFGGSVKGLVPPAVERQLHARLEQTRQQ